MQFPSKSLEIFQNNFPLKLFIFRFVLLKKCVIPKEEDLTQKWKEEENHNIEENILNILKIKKYSIKFNKILKK